VTPSFETPIIIPKKRAIQPGDSFEDTNVSRDLKSSHSKPECGVSTLYLFVKYIQPMAFLSHQADLDKCFCHLFIKGYLLIPVSLLESKSGFDIVTQHRKTPSSHL
jgi:hypothetical protein